MGVHQPLLISLAPARERHVLLDPYLQAVGPAAPDMPELASDHNRPERKRRGLDQDARPGVNDKREHRRVKQARGEVGKARAIQHDRLPPLRAAPTREYEGIGLRTTVRRDAPPWARANGRSSRERC